MRSITVYIKFWMNLKKYLISNDCHRLVYVYALSHVPGHRFAGILCVQ